MAIRLAKSCLVVLAVVGGMSEAVAWAELIRLKNGNTVEGAIVSQTEHEVTVDIPDLGRMTLARDEIASIEGAGEAGQTAVQSETTNAAIYYGRALRQLRYPASREQVDLVARIIREGWPQEQPELVELLQQHEAVRQEFDKGIRLTRCDFQFGRPVRSALQRAIPPVGQLVNLSTVVLLQARYEQSLKQTANAIGRVLSLLIMARHLAQDPSLMARLNIGAIEEGPIVILRQELESDRLSPQLRTQIAEALTPYLDDRLSAAQLIDAQHEAFLSLLRLQADELDLANLATDAQRQWAQQFQHAIMTQGQQQAQHYYGLLRQAADTDRPEDWAAVAQAAQRFHQRLNAVFGNRQTQAGGRSSDSAASPDLIDETAQPEVAAAGYVEAMLALAAPDVDDYYEGIRRHREHGVALRQLQELARQPSP